MIRFLNQLFPADNEIKNSIKDDIIFLYCSAMSGLRVLVGCKRVIDYAVKIRVRPDNLGKYLLIEISFLFIYSSVN